MKCIAEVLWPADCCRRPVECRIGIGEHTAEEPCLVGDAVICVEVGNVHRSIHFSTPLTLASTSRFLSTM